MPIMFNTVLQQAGVIPAEVILLRHQDQRAARGRTPYELWRDDTTAFNLYQSHQAIDGRAKFRRAYWAAFVGNPAGETLFIGLYRANYRGLLEQDTPKPHRDDIDRAGACDVYDLTLHDHFTDLIGKLYIDWGPGTRAWVQRADRRNKSVTELRTAFKEEAFPGFLNFTAQLSTLVRLPASWKTILSGSKGVYILTCPDTKEQYVGSATGHDGFWQRWQDYAITGHGGNVALKSRKRSDYRVAILQVAGTDANYDDIIAMEERWKRKLQSKEMGLNR
jgi:GIY-YIG catalytic domain